MTILFLKEHTLLGKLRRPGELLEVSDTVGTELILAGIAKERLVAGPTETKEPSEWEDPDNDPDA